MEQKKDIWFLGMIVLYVGFALGFILHSSFLVGGVRYFSLFDDAMISMRFARNLTAGNGLVWNAGQVPVEGYTNFLWTLYMAFWHLLPISVSKICLIIQLTGLAFLTASLVLVRRITFDLTGKRSVALAACILTAAYQPLNFWGLRGMETSVIGFVLLLAVWRVFRAVESGRFDPALYIILGIGTLVRIDFGVPALATAAYVAWVNRESRSKELVWGMGTLALFLGGMTVFRGLYYHDVLPNTYYLKMAGAPLVFRLRRGAHVMGLFIKNFSPFLIFLPGVIYATNYLKNKKITFLVFLILVQCLYSIWVGGDAWEWWGNFANRYLCAVLPCFFVLLAISLHRLAEAATAGTEKQERYFSPAVLAALVLLAVWQVYAGNTKLDLSNSSENLWGIHLKDDAVKVKRGLFIKRITTPQAKVGAIWAGAIPYFSERPAVDFLGKSDAVIAHGRNRAWRWEKFYPGHNKYDYKYSIGVLRPDVVDQVWDDYRDAVPILMQHYLPFYDEENNPVYLLKDSKNILWEKVLLQQAQQRFLNEQAKKISGDGASNSNDRKSESYSF